LAGKIPIISTKLSIKDIIGSWKVEVQTVTLNNTSTHKGHYRFVESTLGYKPDGI